MAIIRLKQAIGRTMRRVGQRSAVLILDSRMARNAMVSKSASLWLEAIVLESLAESKYLSTFKIFLHKQRNEYQKE